MSYYTIEMIFIYSMVAAFIVSLLAFMYKEVKNPDRRKL